MTLSTPPATLDLRALAPGERHLRVFSSFRELAPRESVELLNDHDPRRLRDIFQAELPGAFAWDALESGPATWRVRITKLTGGHGHAHSGCCGSCGGA